MAIYVNSRCFLPTWHLIFEGLHFVTVCSGHFSGEMQDILDNSVRSKNTNQNEEKIMNYF